MSLITFTSDFGTTDHYVAAVKARIFTENAHLPIMDISHEIEHCDIMHAAHVVKHAFESFPKGTVHLVSVDSGRSRSSVIAFEWEGHFFVGFNNGLFSLITTHPPDQVFELAPTGSTFAAKDTMASACAQLATGTPPEKLGTPTAMEVLLGRQLKLTRREISGNVMRVDHFGNLITNIPKADFDKIRELNGPDTSFSIRFGRERFSTLHDHFADVDLGECFVLFNSYDVLEIGVNNGNGSKLLGLDVDAPIVIEFQSQP